MVYMGVFDLETLPYILLEEGYHPDSSNIRGV